MIRTTMLSLAAVAVALAGLVAGCKSTDEPTPVPPPEQPEKAQTPAEPVDQAEPLDPASAAWAVSRAPADAALVLAIASPAALEKDLKALLGPDVADEMNLVDAMEKELPPGAIDATGPVVLILPASGEEAQPVTYYHIKDASVIQGTSAGAGTVAVKMRPDPAGPEHTVYCLTTAPWVAVSVDQASLRAVMRAEKHLALTDARRAAIGRRSLWLYADPKPLAELASKAIEAQVKSSEAAGAPPSPPAAIKMVHSLLDLAAGLEGVDLVADVKPTGIDAQADVTIAEGS